MVRAARVSTQERRGTLGGVSVHVLYTLSVTLAPPTRQSAPDNVLKVWRRFASLSHY